MIQEQEKKIESMIYQIIDLLKDEFSNFFFDTIAYGYAEINLDELIRKVNQNQIIENIWNKK
jgi:hypothetical protein